jgi:hypothetical protein
MGASPPCPACGEPLYGWIDAPATDPRSEGSYVVDRCESCGLGMAGIDGEGAAVDLPTPDTERRLANRASWQAGIGGEHWAALDLPAQPLLLTPRSLELLLARRGLRAARLRQTVFGRNQLWMWQTLINAFTFHDNFAREVLRRRLTVGTSRNVIAFAVDAAISILAALPIALIAILLELAAIVLNRGGEMVVTVEREALPRRPGA